jgi:hypothetical protein
LAELPSASTVSGIIFDHLYFCMAHLGNNQSKFGIFYVGPELEQRSFNQFLAAGAVRLP